MISYVLAMGKQHLGPRVVVGYGIKIFWPCLFHYVTRSPGSGALLWNSLPENIGAIRSIRQFKKKATTHLKHPIPTRQSSKSVFIVILIGKDHRN